MIGSSVRTAVANLSSSATTMLQAVCLALVLLVSPMAILKSHSATLTQELLGFGLLSGPPPEPFLPDPGDVLPLGGANLVITNAGDPYDFGFTDQQFPNSFVFTVSNDGTASATEIAINLLRGNSWSIFSAGGDCGSSLGAGTSCNIGIEFEPIFGSGYNDFLVIDYNENFSLTPVPLPAALPLFAGGLGIIGLLGWRQKRMDG